MKKPRTIVGVILIVLGGIMLIFSNYIAEQVAEGRLQIQRGQRAVDATNSLFSISPTTKPLGQMFTSSGQKRINEGRVEADKYESLSNTLKTTGIIFIIAGIAILVFWRKK